MATIKPISTPTKRLANSITASASTFQLADILGWSGSALTSADFGTVAYALFRNPTNTQIEIMEIDPSTIASSSITISRRGLAYDGDLTTESSTRKYAWVKGTQVELGTHFPQLLKHFVDIISAQTIAGVKTFSSTPVSTAGLPTSSTELATKQYVDNTATGTTSINRVVIAGNAGETVSAGNLLYLDVADGEWKKCDADTAGTVNNINIGIAQGAGTDGNPISGGVLIYGLDSNQTGLTNNTKYYASNTAGAISTSAGTTEVSVGISRSTTTLFFSPRYDQQITEDIQDALEGTSGTPSASNKYVTADDVSAAAASGKIVRATGTALPALSGANLTNVPVTTKVNVTTTDTVVSGTGSKTAFYTVSIPANTLGTNNGIMGRVFFTLVSASTTNKDFEFVYDNTVIGVATMTPSAATSTTVNGYIDFTLLGAGATNAQEGSLVVVAGVGGFGVSAFSSNGGGGFCAVQGTAVEDSTTTLNLILNITMNSADTLTARHGYIIKTAA